MLVSEFDFYLPQKAIAQSPTLPREYARMLYFNKKNNNLVDSHFFDLPKFLKSGDVLVMNNSKVMPVRIKLPNIGKSAEILFIEKYGEFWKCLVKPGKKFKIGSQIVFRNIKMLVRGVTYDGFRIIEVNLSSFEMREFFLKNGEMPVPPYITSANYKNEDYNTVYSLKEGSVAAPTAGLHFSSQLISSLISKGVNIEYVSLHVGPGTFLPVKTRDIRMHKMHSEKYEISYNVASKLNRYMKEKRRIIAVGTTSLRVLESNFDVNTGFRSGYFSTDIFISPGYKWKVINGLITNFHLPKSTLLMLVSAFIGKEKVLNLYSKAIFKGYKFFSFGDGMLII